MANDIPALLAEINSTRPILEQVANKWSVLILTVLCSEPARFNAIKRRLDPITHKALTEALRRLERNGLVSRRVSHRHPWRWSMPSLRWAGPCRRLLWRWWAGPGNMARPLSRRRRVMTRSVPMRRWRERRIIYLNFGWP